MASIVKLFDGYVLDKFDRQVDFNDEKYDEKVIGLYFSAHWCPPCRAFTPKLVKFYKKYAIEKNFEVIFLSSDRDEHSFDEYYEEMPWLKLDYQQRKKKEKIAKKFHVEEIPTLILLEADSGDIICTDAVEQVDEDPKGQDFPWNSEK